MTDEVPEERRARIADDPFCELVGIELVELGPGEATTELELTDRHVNFHGIPHGGAINALADAAFAAASNSHGQTAVALETNMSYLEAVETGETVTATAEETHAAGKTAEYEVEVTDGSGDRIAAFRGRVYRPE